NAQGPTTVNSASFLTTTALASNNQQYVVEVTQGVGAAACTASSPQVLVNESPEVPLTLSPNTCVNPITITAVGSANSYAWTGPNIVPATVNAATVQATPPNGTHTYNLTATQTGFCQLDTAITVVVEGILTPDFALPDACSDQAFLSAQPVGTYTYRWYRNSTALPGGGGQQISVTTADNGARYRVEVVNTVTGCVFTSAEKQVAIQGDLQITLASTPPCQEAPFTITTTANLSPVTIQWFRNGVQIPNQSGTSIVQTENGLYSVRVATTGDQCVRTQDFNIILSPNPPGLLPEKGIICPDPANLDPTTQQVVLDAGPDNLSYEWFKDGVSTGVTTQTYTATDVGFYEVAMTNSFMCSNTDGITLVEECDPRITGPNAFRPGSEVNEGGEYVNREFKLFTFFIADTDFQIFIFNRWGEMVFQSASRDFKWNGGYNNNPAQPLPPGTYSYKVQFKSTYRPGEGIQEKRGGVVLLR
ncbi:MAG TPA: gliding motility-associated C-terminal domain-containing protein, partial [Chryseosolibacter sp.]